MLPCSARTFEPKKDIEERAVPGYRKSMNGDWHNCPEVERDPGKVSGAWVFRGTRVPVLALFENIEDGASVDDFLEWFPGVSRRQVEAVLSLAETALAVESPA